MVGGRRVGDVKHPKSPPGTMIQEVRERGDENMDSDSNRNATRPCKSITYF